MIVQHYNIFASSRQILSGIGVFFIRYFEWVICAAVFVGVATCAVIFKLDFTRLAFGNLQRIHLEGEYKHLDRYELEDTLSSAIGQSLLDIDLNIFTQRLSQMPWVKDVFIERVWPNRLNIRIKERKVVARWEGRGLVDQSGEVFFPSTYSYPEKPSIITAKDRVPKALSFYYYLRDVFAAIGTRVVYLVEDPSHSWEVGLQDGYTLKLGRNHLAERIQRFIASYSVGLNDVINKVECIDLRYPDGFAVRWKVHDKLREEQRIC